MVNASAGFCQTVIFGPLLLAFGTEKGGAAGHGLLCYGGCTALAELTLSAVCLQLKLKITAFATGVYKVTDGGTAACYGFLQNMAAACNDSFPFLSGEATDLFLGV